MRDYSAEEEQYIALQVISISATGVAATSAVASLNSYDVLTQNFVLPLLLTKKRHWSGHRNRNQKLYHFSAGLLCNHEKITLISSLQFPCLY